MMSYYPYNCTYSTPMNQDTLKEHLLNVHELYTPVFLSVSAKRKRQSDLDDPFPVTEENDRCSRCKEHNLECHLAGAQKRQSNP
jgi:hypothetical protein